MADRIIALTVSPILPQSLRPCRTAALCGTCWLLIDTFLSSRPYSLARHRVRAAGHRESVSAERQVAEHIAAQRTCCIVWRAAALRICQSQEHNCHIGLKVHFRFWWRMYVPRSGRASHGNVMRSQGSCNNESNASRQPGTGSADCFFSCIVNDAGNSSCCRVLLYATSVSTSQQRCLVQICISGSWWLRCQ